MTLFKLSKIFYTVKSCYSIPLHFLLGILAGSCAIVLSPIIVIGFVLYCPIKNENPFDGHTSKTLFGIGKKGETHKKEKKQNRALNFIYGLGYGLFICFIFSWFFPFSFAYDEYIERYPKQNSKPYVPHSSTFSTTHATKLTSPEAPPVTKVPSSLFHNPAPITPPFNPNYKPQ